MNVGNMDLLALSFYLSVLSYCTGLAIRALPVPFLAIKRLGRSLVTEGVFSCILTFSYRTLLYSIDFFSRLLGSDLALYTTWLTERVGVLLALIAVLKAVGVLLSKLGLGFFAQGFISQVTGLMTTSLTTLIATSIVYTIIYSASPFLIALGIVLHAVPFKLTRNIGATIIAITLVFSVGMPLMPLFVSTFSNMSGSLITSKNLCTATIMLVDASGTPFGQAVIEGYIEDALVYRYKVDGKGVLVVDEVHGFPCTDHVARFDIAGNGYLVTLSGVTGRNWNLAISIPNILAIAANRFMLFNGSIEVKEVLRSSDGVVLILNASTESSGFKLYTESNDVLQVYIDSETVTPLGVESLDWYGIRYTVYTYILKPGNHRVEVYLSYYSTTPINVDLYPYTIAALGLDPLAPENLLFYVTRMFIELTVLPLVYITMLGAITLNVARLLGGASTSIARIVVNY
ncbi:MAG: hypothetical protein QXP03_05480 [Desulfurococcaceae archaeon]